MAAPNRSTKAFRVSSASAGEQVAHRARVAGGRAMIWLKGCPKCRGDMHYDPLVEEYVCLQCGLAVERLPSQSAEPSPEALTAGVASGKPPRPDRKSL